MSSSNSKKAKLFHEDVKDRQTSHWDLDLLSRAELEELMSTHETSVVVDSADDQSDQVKK